MPKIYSIFCSVNGEINVNGIGSPTIFIRFAGCTANCPWCDTTYANDINSGIHMSIDHIIATLKQWKCFNVTITGGEPLEQRDDLRALLLKLDSFGYNVSVETNGLHAFNVNDMPAHWIVDIKNHVPIDLHKIKNMRLTERDFIKIVIGDLPTFIKMVDVKERLQSIGCKAKFAFSPEFGKITPDQILIWMKSYGQLDAVLNFQAHKVLVLTESN